MFSANFFSRVVLGVGVLRATRFWQQATLYSSASKMFITVLFIRAWFCILAY